MQADIAADSRATPKTPLSNPIGVYDTEASSAIVAVKVNGDLTGVDHNSE